MLRKALTLATAIVALGGAFAGTATAKKLLVSEGWYRNADGTEPIDTATAMRECFGFSQETCAYFFNEGATEGDPSFFKI